MPRRSSQRLKALKAIPRAKLGAPPRFLPMVAPTLTTELPWRGDGLHEVKFDGYRMEVRLVRCEVSITSLNELEARGVSLL